ncbi:MAG: hypothetical protein WC378_03480 [Opitutaceae bacterium]|jgi:hypothetical protein
MDKPKAELFAVIAASVAATIGKKAEIRSINNVSQNSSESFIWSLEGRRTLFHSHKVR